MRGLDFAKTPAADAALWLNVAGTVARVDNSTLIVAIDYDVVTPPLSVGAFDDFWRETLMARALVEEKAFTPDDLSNARSAAVIRPWGTVVPVANIGSLEEALTLAGRLRAAITS